MKKAKLIRSRYFCIRVLVNGIVKMLNKRSPINPVKTGYFRNVKTFRSYRLPVSSSRFVRSWNSFAALRFQNGIDNSGIDKSSPGYRQDEMKMKLDDTENDGKGRLEMQSVCLPATCGAAATGTASSPASSAGRTTATSK